MTMPKEQMNGLAAKVIDMIAFKPFAPPKNIGPDSPVYYPPLCLVRADGPIDGQLADHLQKLKKILGATPELCALAYSELFKTFDEDNVCAQAGGHKLPTLGQMAVLQAIMENDPEPEGVSKRILHFLAPVLTAGFADKGISTLRFQEASVLAGSVMAINPKTYTVQDLESFAAGAFDVPPNPEDPEEPVEVNPRRVSWEKGQAQMLAIIATGLRDAFDRATMPLEREAIVERMAFFASDRFRQAAENYVAVRGHISQGLGSPMSYAARAVDRMMKGPVRDLGERVLVISSDQPPRFDA